MRPKDPLLRAQLEEIGAIHIPNFLSPSSFNKIRALYNELNLEDLGEIYSNVKLDTEQVKVYAKKFNTHPAIIMGRIAHKAETKYDRAYFYKIGWSEGLFEKVLFE